MKRLHIVIVTLSLAACKTIYVNPNVPNDRVEQEFAIADGTCQGVSYGSIPMPIYQPVQAAPSGYNVSGNYNYNNTGYGGYGSYTGTVTPTYNPADSAAAGFANGAQLGAIFAAKSARERVYGACMARLGWIEEGIYKKQEAARAARNETPVRASIASQRPASLVQPILDDGYSCLRRQAASNNIDTISFGNWVRSHDDQAIVSMENLCLDGSQEGVKNILANYEKEH